MHGGEGTMYTTGGEFKGLLPLFPISTIGLLVSAKDNEVFLTKVNNGFLKGCIYVQGMTGN